MTTQQTSEQKQSRKNKTKRRKSTRKVAGRVVLGTAAAAAIYIGTGDSVDAGIITNLDLGLPGFTISAGNPIVNWDIDDDGLSEFSFNLSASTQLIFTSSNGRGLVQATPAFSTSDFNNLPELFVVGPTLAGPTGATNYAFAPAVFAAITASGTFSNAVGFTSGVDGYIGFQFDGVPDDMADPATIGDQIRYGWARVNITPDTAGNSIVTVLAWAYEDSGAAIQVVPEPCSAGLMGLSLLACGAAGVRRWRRERKQETDA